MTATTSSAINSAEADALFIASMGRIQQQDLLRPFSPLVNALLEKLTPSQHAYLEVGDLTEYFQTDMRPILRKSGVNKTSANPSGWKDSTQIIALRSILDGRETCKAADLNHSTIAELTSTEAVLALEARIGKGWSSQRVAMILADLRRMAILVDGSCNPWWESAVPSMQHNPKETLTIASFALISIFEAHTRWRQWLVYCN